MSAYITTICALAVNALRKLNKEIVTPEDVTKVLKDAGIDSVDGRQNYTKRDGYLVENGCLIRCIGGWSIAPEACTTVTITVKVTPGMAAGKVFMRMAKATAQYEGIVEMQMEV